MTVTKIPQFAVAAPIFPVSDLKASLTYYTGYLGFETGFEWSDSDDEPIRYAILFNGDTELHLSQTENPRRTTAYFFLHGVAEYYDRVRKTDARIAFEIEDQPWRMREFEVTDPDGNALIFGEHLDRIAERES